MILEFTPLEFETQALNSNCIARNLLEFTPLEFETSTQKDKVLCEQD